MAQPNGQMTAQQLIDTVMQLQQGEPKSASNAKLS